MSKTRSNANHNTTQSNTNRDTKGKTKQFRMCVVIEVHNFHQKGGTNNA
jgi:hypothetical protein